MTVWNQVGYTNHVQSNHQLSPIQKRKKNHQLRKSKRRNKKIKKINKQKQLRTRDNGLVGTGLTEG